MRTRTVVNNDDLLTRCTDKIDRPCYATSKASRLRAAGIAANQQKVPAQEIRRRRRRGEKEEEEEEEEEEGEGGGGGVSVKT